MDEAGLKQRTKAFALRVMKLVGALPETSAGRTIGIQLVRSATSVGANYRSACRGRSKPEFVAKLGIVVEEADECGYWLELIIDGELLKKALVDFCNRISARKERRGCSRRVRFSFLTSSSTSSSRSRCSRS